jgi:acyl-CoA thioesterase I
MKLKLFLNIVVFLMGYPAVAETVILFAGDSLTAGYGVLKKESFPSLLEEEWLSAGRQVRIINAAQSGSLASALAGQLEFHLKRAKPAVIVIISGGNDARQLAPTAAIEKSLRAAVRKAKASGAKVFLGEMRIFPNYGKEYADGFAAIYPRVAREEKAELLPFILADIAGRAALNQADGFHPNAAGHKKIAAKIKPYLEKRL